MSLLLSAVGKREKNKNTENDNQKDSQGVAHTVGTVGMLDLITDKFYGNAGIGVFTAG